MNFVELTFILSVVMLTTAAAWAISHRTVPLDFVLVIKAIRGLAEWAGAFTIFFAANACVGAVAILSIRSLTAHFISLYALENMFFVILSAAQAFVFMFPAWRGQTGK